MDNLRIGTFGPSGLLIEFADRMDSASLARCRGLLHCLDENLPEGLRDITPAYQSILLEFEEKAPTPDQIADLLKSAQPLAPEAMPCHEIPVVYDGPDMEALSQRHKLAVPEVIELHSAPVYDVFLVGFSPGFPYLGPLDPRLHTPRLDNPRPRVPVGSVAIGGGHTGIYSIPSAGGWWLIGRTETKLFSEEAARGPGSDSAFLIRQGDRVKFQPMQP